MSVVPLFGKVIRAVFGDILIFPFAFEVRLPFLVPLKLSIAMGLVFSKEMGAEVNPGCFWQKFQGPMCKVPRSNALPCD